MSKREFFLAQCSLNGDINFFPALRLQVHYQLPCFSGLQTWIRTKLLSLLGLHLPNSPCRSWDLPASIINLDHFPSLSFLLLPLLLLLFLPLSISPSSLYIYSYRICSGSLENPDQYSLIKRAAQMSIISAFCVYPILDPYHLLLYFEPF